MCSQHAFGDISDISDGEVVGVKILAAQCRQGTQG